MYEASLSERILREELSSERYAPFPKSEFLKVFNRYRKSEDPEDRRELLERNLRFVRKIARAYIGRGLDLEELFSEGYIGMERALEKYKPEKGAFTTYSSYWIKQNIGRAILNQSRTIRLPVCVEQDFSRIRKAVIYLESKMGRRVSDEEAIKIARVREGRLEQYKRHSSGVVSLESSATEAGKDKMIYYALSSENHLLEDLEIRDEGSAYLEALIELTTEGGLSERNLNIFSMRLGLFGYEAKHTLGEVGKAHGITRERSRQIVERISQTLMEIGRKKKLVS
jgi:RNA polymerase sigma factor (sigma-70 family)